MYLLKNIFFLHNITICNNTKFTNIKKKLINCIVNFLVDLLIINNNLNRIIQNAKPAF